MSSVAVLFVGLLAARPALADVEFNLPADWAKQSSVDGSAVQRANAWADALGGRVIRTEGSASIDNFVETLAVINFDSPLKAGALENNEAAQAYLDELMQPLVGDARAEDLQRVPLPTTKVMSIRGHYLVGGTRLETVLLPDGTKTTLVIVGGLESEHILYAPIMSPLLDSIDGGAAPVEPFDVGSFRTKYLIAWLLAFLGIYFGSIAAFSERKGDHKRTGGFSALITGALAIVAALVTWLVFGGDAASLEAVGSTASDLASEVFGVGVLGALVIFGVAQLLESDSGPIQSAPVRTAINVPATPPAGHIPNEPSEIEAIELTPEPENAKAPPPAPSRVPPPPSSTRRRVESSKLKAADQPARLEDARSDSK